MLRVFALSLIVAVGCSAPAPKKSDEAATKDKNNGDKKAKKGKADKKPAKEADKLEIPEPDAALLDPGAANEKAPDKYKVKFDTTKGEFVIAVTRSWAPVGADRFYNLVKIGYYNDVAFFRAVKGFMVQFGIHGHPKVNRLWRSAKIKDDPVKKSNTKGFITFATSGTDSRTSQVFINYGNNGKLDGMGFAPFGKVAEGMKVVNSLHTGYGDSPPNGRGPNQGAMQRQGNSYLKERFPDLDYVKTATIVE